MEQSRIKFTVGTKTILLSLLLNIFWLENGFTQSSFSITSFNETDETFKHLLSTNAAIAAIDTINERIIDLVVPTLMDSLIKRKRQHHRVFWVGWMIHTFAGYNWRAMNLNKQKLVGTAYQFGHSSKIEYTEYDVNFHLRFHLPQYFDLVCRSYERQRKIHKQDINPKNKKNYNGEPYLRSQTECNPDLYRLETELTPPHAFIAPLHYLFYPTLPRMGGLKEHPNFETKYPSMGFYGVNCLDCNHDCHPEIHPYEWVWWLKAKEDDTTKEKTWLIGLFKDGSNRFKRWSTNPKIGSIKIPFAYDLSEDRQHICGIDIQHLVFNKFEEEGIKQLQLPDSTIDARKKSVEISIVENDYTLLNVPIHFNNSLQTEGLKYWFSSLNFDRQNMVVSGYFHLAASVRDLYTTKITFHQNRDN